MWWIAKILAFSLLVLLYAPSCITQSYLNLPVCNNSTVLPSNKEYIVMFDSYMNRDWQQQTLSSALNGFEGQWDLIARGNEASRILSDFALISVSNEGIVKKLEQHLHVRYIVPERRIINPLKGIEEPIGGVNNAGKYHRGFPQMMNEEVAHTPGTRRLHSNVFQVTDLFNTHVLWDKGFTGSEVRVAIFDTGLRHDHPHFRNVDGTTNWTNEDSIEDGLGHGTFVAGIVASQHECYGFAPDASLYIYRVFTNNRVSYTSWFLDAFNHALQTKIDVLNLSIGGPDFMDRPFVEKVWELSANGMIVVSAIGNDGPLFGTLNNPADQLDVIGVGGIDYGENIAPFSSRGMTTWELPSGYGRVKPDILAYGQSVQGSRIHGGCRALSGTSVASPVVAGAITLLASTIPEEDRKKIVNPASIKQVLIESAERLPASTIFEQGYGKLNLLGAYQLLSTYEPRATLAPPSLDFTDCPYMWPYCSQPLYTGALPVVFNVTILNGLGVTGEILEPGPTWLPGRNGEYLKVTFSYSKSLWPWTGHIAVHLTVSELAAGWEGAVEGEVMFNISSPGVQQRMVLPVKAKIVPTPPRSRRLLWDQFHNLQYPAGYFPRDMLDKKDELFDWNGDHPHTNFRSFYAHLRNLGYYIELLGVPYTCVDPEEYGALLIIDPEDEFYPAEIEKLREDVVEHGLSVIVVSDWYNTDIMAKIKFYDDNARQWWIPATGGSNIPALNELLSGFGIMMGDKVYDGEFSIGSNSATYMSGTSIVSFPEGGHIMQVTLIDQTAQIIRSRSEKSSDVAVLGFFTPAPNATTNATAANVATGGDANETQAQRQQAQDVVARPDPGTIAVFGDSSCLDDAAGKGTCFWVLERILKVTNRGAPVKSEFPDALLLDEPYHVEGEAVLRLDEASVTKYSHVIDQPLTCPRIIQSIYPYRWKDKKNLSVVPWERKPVPPRVRPGPGPGPIGRVSGFPSLLMFAFVMLAVLFIIVAFVRLRDVRSLYSPKRVPV